MSNEVVEIDGKCYLVMEKDGKDVAIPVDETHALAEIKKAEASIEKQKTVRLSEVTSTLIVLALIATCAFT